jgi:hypothetical protein
MKGDKGGFEHHPDILKDVTTIVALILPTIPLIENDRYFSSTQSFCLLSDKASKASFSQREGENI